MGKILKKIGWFFTLVGGVCLAWVLISWLNQRPISSYLMLGVLILVLGLVLLRRPEGSTDAEPLSPSQRESQKHQHKSWINGGKK
ncbi:MAG: hypothetical protein WA110_01820 [Anaerolineaceae bacterium]